jgi:hypothetical protein
MDMRKSGYSADALIVLAYAWACTAPTMHVDASLVVDLKTLVLVAFRGEIGKDLYMAESPNC